MEFIPPIIFFYFFFFYYSRTLEVSNATERSLLENKIRELEFQKSRAERERTNLEGELIASQKEIVGLKCSIAEMSSASAGMRAELEILQRQLNSEKTDNTQLRNNLSAATAEIQELQVRLFYLMLIDVSFIEHIF